MSTELDASIHNSGEWWRVALSSIGDGIIVTDVSGNVAFMNPVSETLTGWTSVEAKGRSINEIFQIVNESTRTALDNPVDQVIQTGAVVPFANHTMLVGRNGRSVDIDDSAAPIKNEQGEVFGVVLVFRDISDRKRAQRTQRQLAAIVESSNDAILSENLDGIVLTWNKGAEAIYGYATSEIVGRPISLLVPSDRTHEISMIRDRIIRGERLEHFETVRRRKDGTRIDISLTVSPIVDESGQTIGISKIARDISEKRRAEGEKSYLATIVASSDDAIVSKTLDSVITSWNKAAEKMFGYTSEEAIGRQIYIIIPPDRHGEETEILSKIKSGQSVDHFETVRRRKDGVFINVSLTISPIRDTYGNIIGASKIARDITQKKRAEDGRAYLAAIIESSDDAIISKTLDSVITSWNKAAEKMFGFTAEEAIGQQIYIIIPSDRYGEEAEILARIRSGEGVDHYETVRHRKDGVLIDVSLTVSPIRDVSGNIVGASKMARDITDRKRADAQLREEREALEIINRVGQTLSSELELEKVVQTFTDAATSVTGAAFGAFFYNVVDPRGASYMLFTLSGVPREHFVNFPMPRSTDLLGPTFRDEGVIRIDDVKKDERYGKNPPYFGMPEGHLPVTSYLAVPVRSHSKEVIGALLFGHPQPGVFTERHERIVVGLAGQAGIAMDNAQLFEATRRARLEAENANRLKDEFLATVSHELRTPLNAILGWARLLHLGNLEDESRARAVEIIERNALAQSQLIEDILDVSRIITGKLRLDVTPVEVGQLVADAVETVRPTAEAKGVRLQAVLDTKANLVRGDSHRLQQVLWNLLSNAIKFTPKGGRVMVELSRIDSHVEIAVTDTGKGIRPEFLPYVFDRFRQGDSSTIREHGGLGLGLAIVRHLTDLHGGSASAFSAGEGQGATFTVTLPLAILRERKEPIDRRTRLAPAVEGSISIGPDPELKGVRVLVVDDDPDARELLRMVLERTGAELRVAASTNEALTIFKEWMPDVLVSDVGMPGKDGFELIRQVRALPHSEGGSVPAAALTAYATGEDRLKALTSGFQIHVAKPVEPLELIAVVASLAGRTGIAKDKR